MAERWDQWVAAAVGRLSAANRIVPTCPITLPAAVGSTPEIETFDGPQPWDRSSVEVEIDERHLRRWLQGHPNPAEREVAGGNEGETTLRKIILFSGSDFLGLSTHPSGIKAAVKAAEEHGMGPRGSSSVCGYTNYHMKLEAALADLKKKADCLLCPTGFSANMAFMTALGSVSSLLVVGRKPLKDERIAVFSDALNHASIIDGIRLAARQQEVEFFVYMHCNMVHLDVLLSGCKMEKKVVITDGVFSMDGDFAPMTKLVELRKKHGFLLVVDDAHATLVCGENGGGIPEFYQCEKDVDVCIGTLSKAAGCQGGFIACSNKWRQLIQSRGRSFLFSASLPVPIAAAAHASLIVARKETWRRREIWRRVHEFNSLTNLRIASPIVSIVVGSEESALIASRHMVHSGFHVTAIWPPGVPPNACRLRITLSATHTANDVRRMVAALSCCIKLPHVEGGSCQIASKL